MRTYICDIDGTLADNRHRNPYDESKVLDDKPLPTCDIIKSLIRDGNKVIYFSGRTEECRVDTERWLIKHVSLIPVLYMRKTGDRRPDTIIKREMYDRVFTADKKPDAVFDDRLSVVKMWESLGLFVFNCNQGLVDF